MSRWLVRVAGAALVGALAAAACFAALYAMRPDVTLDMDRDAPVLSSGFYPPERAGDLTFVWTSRRADLTLPGLDRCHEWMCSVTFRGARPPQIPQPDLDIGVDGVGRGASRGTNEFQTIAVTAPASDASGLRLTLTSSSTFVPSDADKRALGVQVDRIACRPGGRAFVVPPRGALGRAAGAGVIWGAGFGLSAFAWSGVIAATALVAAGQAIPLSTGVASYTTYPDTLVRLAGWITLLMVGAMALSSAWTRDRLAGTSRFVIAFSAAAFYLKLLALLHPSKSIADAVFHAHRYEWVLAGRYYFTQLSTSGTPFPYAIGLYLFAAPWSALTRDHVTLLRVIVCASDAIAGLLLYPMIVRAWSDKVTGAIAVVLFSVVPLSYVVIGNANLTNAFGQSVSIVTVVVATTWISGMSHVPQWLAVTALAALGLTSHISTFLLLTSTLLVLAGLTWWSGGRDLRGPARSILLATIVAALVSVATYWGHFSEVYAAQFARVRADSSQVVSSRADSPADAPVGRDGTSRLGRVPIPLSGRVADSLSQTIANIGWPILLLAGVGIWRVWVERRRDRAVFAIAAWAIVCVTFVTVSVLSATDVRYQQDGWEFIGRVEHATYPAAVVLAACGARWASRGTVALRAVSAALLVSAVVLGVQHWTRWLS